MLIKWCQEISLHILINWFIWPVPNTFASPLRIMRSAHVSRIHASIIEKGIKCYFHLESSDCTNLLVIVFVTELILFVIAKVLNSMRPGGLCNRHLIRDEKLALCGELQYLQTLSKFKAIMFTITLLNMFSWKINRNLTSLTVVCLAVGRKVSLLRIIES